MTASPLKERTSIPCARPRRPKSPAPEPIVPDRRSNRRYEIALDLRWRLTYRNRLIDTGFGRTVDLSSRGALFKTDRELPVGLRISLSVEWPVLLNDATRLQLIVEGEIVRSARTWAAIRAERHEFRTAVSCKAFRECS
jgi:hypothetical protein